MSENTNKVEGFTLQDLLQLYPEFSGKRIKLIRHRLKDDARELAKTYGINSPEPGVYSDLTARQKIQNLRVDSDLLEAYSSEYGNSELQDCDVVFVFGPIAANAAELLGVFEVNSNPPTEFGYDQWTHKYAEYLIDVDTSLKTDKNLRSKHFPNLGYSGHPTERSNFYDIRPVKGAFVETFKRRLVVEWIAPRKWVQRKLDKEILQIRPKGFVREWNGFHDFILSYAELSELVRQQDTNSEWMVHLSSVAGVYAIQNTKNGMLYIGSAYSEVGGIWGRWAGYAKTKTNGNKELVELLENDPDAINHLQFSILKIMDIKSRVKDVIAEESLLKNKLGSRKFGYNAN